MPWKRTLLALLLVTGVTRADDWPQWLGPNRNGYSISEVVPWKKAPKVVWRKPVEEGHSSPVVAGGKVFLHTKIEGKNEEELTAYDARTGERLWHTSYPRAAFKSLFGNGPRATPTVVKDRIYTFGITGILTCFNTSGKQLWQVDTLKEFKAKNLFFGASCSPLVEGNKVLVNVGGKGASVVAFDKEKGTVVWKSQNDRASYSSPIVVNYSGTRQVVFLTQENVLSLNPADGSRYWSFPLKDKLLESSTTPVHLGEFLVASSITYGSVGLRLDLKEQKPVATEEWKNKDLTCYFSTPVGFEREVLFMVVGQIPNPLAPKKNEGASLRCVELSSGKELWRKEKIGTYHASMIRTGNQKILLLDDAGNLILLQPDVKGYKELARAKVCGPTWAHPALANDRLYLRDEKELICLEFGQ
jgi:outer membrane protein assembly factor BamB